MPRYFFDVSQDGTLTTDPDPEGLELASLQVACTEAFRTLGEIVREVRSPDDALSLACTVRDGNGHAYRVELSIRCVPLH